MAVNKKTLLQQGLKLLSNPHVIKLMQDERLMKTLVGAMSLPGRAQTFAKDQLENVAKAMDLARETEVRDLRRTVRRLEDEMAHMKSGQAKALDRSEVKVTKTGE
jgi:hypothetical protein